MSTAVGSAIFDASEAHGKLWVGRWHDASANLPVREPATGETLLEVGRAGGDDVARAAREAAAAQPDWAFRPATERAAVMTRAAELLETHHEEAEAWLVREAGSIRPKAGFEVMQLVLGELKAAAALSDEPLEHEVAGQPGQRSLIRRVPVGVVGVLSPWNFPMILAIRSVAPALALGNAVVLKADPHTPVSGRLLPFIAAARRWAAGWVAARASGRRRAGTGGVRGTGDPNGLLHGLDCGRPSRG